MAKKYFGTDGIRGHVGKAPIDPEFVLKLGWAAGCVLADGPGSKILVGKDTRISGYMFESVLDVANDAEVPLDFVRVCGHVLGRFRTLGAHCCFPPRRAKICTADGMFENDQQVELCRGAIFSSLPKERSLRRVSLGVRVVTLLGFKGSFPFVNVDGVYVFYRRF